MQSSISDNKSVQTIDGLQYTQENSAKPISSRRTEWPCKRLPLLVKQYTLYCSLDFLNLPSWVMYSEQTWSFRIPPFCFFIFAVLSSKIHYLLKTWQVLIETGSINGQGQLWTCNSQQCNLRQTEIISITYEAVITPSLMSCTPPFHLKHKGGVWETQLHDSYMHRLSNHIQFRHKTSAHTAQK